MNTPENNVCHDCKRTFKRYTDLMFHIVAGCNAPKTKRKKTNNERTSVRDTTNTMNEMSNHDTPTRYDSIIGSKAPTKKEKESNK